MISEPASTPGVAAAEDEEEAEDDAEEEDDDEEEEAEEEAEEEDEEEALGSGTLPAPWLDLVAKADSTAEADQGPRVPSCLAAAIMSACERFLFESFSLVSGGVDGCRPVVSGPVGGGDGGGHTSGGGCAAGRPNRAVA